MADAGFGDLASDGRPAGGYPEGVLDVRRLGRTRYEDTHGLQERLVAARVAGAWGDTLLLTEHEPVITLGRGSPALSEEEVGLPVVEVERGGEATYHGVGQVVAYPILRLAESRRDLHRYLRDLEQVVIDVLAEVGLRGERRPGLTGVWIGEGKVASVGVAVRRWVTWHGLALNVRTDLEAYQRFRPCGLDPGVMTRVVDHVEDLPPTSALFEVLTVKHVCAVFGLELPPPRPFAPGPGEPDPTLLPILPG